MNLDAERLDPRFGQDNLSLDVLAPEDIARYRNGSWLRGTKVPETTRAKPRGDHNKQHPSLIDASPYVQVVRALLARGFTGTQLGLYADVGPGLIRDLAHGKTRVQARTALKLRRLLDLLPSESA